MSAVDNRTPAHVYDPDGDCACDDCMAALVAELAELIKDRGFDEHD